MKANETTSNDLKLALSSVLKLFLFKALLTGISDNFQLNI